MGDVEDDECATREFVLEQCFYIAKNVSKQYFNISKDYSSHVLTIKGYTFTDSEWEVNLFNKV